MNIPDSRSALAAGSQIGVYEIRALTGGDYQSLTYNAWNHHLNTAVLLREYFPYGLAERSADGMRIEVPSETARKRFKKGLAFFLDEVEKLADIDHAAVPRVLNALEFNDTGYQITSFEKGPTLGVWLDSAYSFKPDEVRMLFETLLAGLKAVHERGLVHGMICPENILLRDAGDPLLINFSADVLQFASEEGRLPDVLKEGYAPAEQYRPDHRPAPADDLYALAATLYRCTTGRNPVPARDRLARLSDGNPDPLPSLFSFFETQVPAPWMRALDWMLRPEAKERPECVGQVDAFLAELAREAETNPGPSGFGKFLSDRFRKSAARGRWAVPSILVLILALGLWSIRHFQIPEISGTGTPGGKKTASGGEFKATPGPADTRVPETADTHRSDLEPRRDETGSIAAGASSSQSAEPAAAFGDARSKESRAGGPGAAAEAKRGAPAPDGPPAKPPESLSRVEPARPDPVIDKHLAAAEKNLAAFDLTTPEEDNAYAHYRAVLKLDPVNPKARAGIHRVMEGYVRLIESAVRRGRIRSAVVYLARVENITADWPPPDAVLGRLERAKQALSDRR